MTETRAQAVKKWREYKDAARKSNDPVYKDLQKTYNQIKNGRKVIDIGKVIQKGGIHDNYHPKLAIAKATSKQVYCQYNEKGKVLFANSKPHWHFKALVSDVVIENCLPIIPRSVFSNNWQSHLELSAPVPMIPAIHLPDKLTDDYYILWEVDTWTQVPPVDPYLLRRITPNIFVIVAAWDLTELERAVMKGRMV